MNLAELKALVADIEASVRPHNPNPNICFWDIASNTVFTLALANSARGCIISATERDQTTRQCKDGDFTFTIRDVQRPDAFDR